MGHGILETDKMISGKGILPWHFYETGKDGRSIIKPGCVSVQEALEAIGCAGINVGTSKVARIILEDGREMDAPEFRNTDTGLITPSYVILQNDRPLAFCGDRQVPGTLESTFGPVQEVISSLGARVTTAGSLWDRHRFFMVFELPETKMIGGDEYRKYLVVLTAHDGSMARRYLWSAVRVVCANTWSLALDEAFDARRAARKAGQPNDVMRTVRHTKGASERIKSAIEQLQVAKKFFDAFDIRAEEMLATAFPNKEWQSLKETLIPIHVDDDGESSKRAITRAENAREVLQTEYDAPDIANIKGTAWGALQSVIAYDQHARTSRNTQKTLPQERTFLRSVEGSDIITKAQAILSEYSGVKV